jgi:hypothetical protein
MNIDENFFNDSVNKQELLNILNEKMSDINNKLLLIDEKLNNLQNKQKQLEIKFNNIEISFANLNKNNFIESYKNLRRGLVFPHSTVLSRDISDITHQDTHKHTDNMD